VKKVQKEKEGGAPQDAEQGKEQEWDRFIWQRRLRAEQKIKIEQAGGWRNQKEGSNREM